MDPWAEPSPWNQGEAEAEAGSSSTTSKIDTSPPSPPLPPQSDTTSDPWASNSPVKERIPGESRSANFHEDTSTSAKTQNDQTTSTITETALSSVTLDPWSSGGSLSQQENLTPRANSDLALPSTTVDGGWGESLDQDAYQEPVRSPADPWGNGNIQSGGFGAGSAGQKDAEAEEQSGSAVEMEGQEEEDRAQDWNPSAGEVSL